MVKKYVTIKGLKVVRKFNGRPYQLVTHTLNTRKKDTEKSANNYRQRGYLARVIPAGGGYALYIRKDTMGL